MNLLPLKVYRWIILALGLLTGVAAAADSGSALSLMPWPHQVEAGTGAFVIEKDFSVASHGFNSPRLERNKQRLLQRIEKQTGVSVDAGVLKAGKRLADRGLNIYVARGPAEAVQGIDADESYRLTVSTDDIELRADSPLGAIRGMETLLQLVSFSASGEATVPAVSIVDSPRFKWRGLLLDPARHFLPVAAVKRQLDGLAAAKFNVLHLHLTDDQGWRIESKVFPRLHERGSDGLYYSQDEIREIVSYAYDRGIRVIPEIDMPGHATAIAVAYPQYIATPEGHPGSYQIERSWGIHKPTLNPVDERVYQFIDQLIGEMAGLFPDPYFHIGGDEVDPAFWDNNRRIQGFIREHDLIDSRGLQAYFNQRVAGILQRYRKKMVGWDEIHHSALPRDIVIQSWRGYDSLNRVVRAGGQGILSTGFYVDQPQPTAYHYRNDPNPSPRKRPDRIAPTERWQSWEFEITRLRGAPVKGSFTLIGKPDEGQRGYIDFAGRSRRSIADIRTIKGVTRFAVDTWMGELRPEFSQAVAHQRGKARVANGQYSMVVKKTHGSDTGAEKPAAGITLPPLDGDLASGILGAEATLWGENVIADVVDLRLWPRAFAIGERLWSAQAVRDEQDMYRRLEQVSHWAERSVDLLHKQQARGGMLRLSGGRDIQPLEVLAQAVEQAQYYHRHHAKAQAGNYHQAEPLNRFVDTLPPESRAVRDLGLLVRRWLQNRADQAAKSGIVNRLSAWNANHPRVMALVNGNPSLEEIAPVVKSVRDVARLGLTLIEAVSSGRKLKPAQVEKAAATLQLAMQIRAEMVVSSAYAVEELLLAAY